MNVPKPRPLLGTVSPTVPCTCIADEAFPPLPYSGKVMSKENRSFNYRHYEGMLKANTSGTSNNVDNLSQTNGSKCRFSQTFKTYRSLYYFA